MDVNVLPENIKKVLNSPVPDEEFEKEHGVGAMIWRRFLRKEIIEREFLLEMAKHFENTADNNAPIAYKEIPTNLKRYIEQRIKGIVERDPIQASSLGAWIQIIFLAKDENDHRRDELIWARKEIKNYDYVNGKVANINKVLDQYRWHAFPDEEMRHAKIVQQMDREERERAK